MLKRIIKRSLPLPVLRAVRKQIHPIKWGNMRRISPVTYNFGTDRGKPIDRYYIESFLERNSRDIRGRVLEIGDPGYTLKYGGERVGHSDVLHAASGNPQATLVGDLQTGAGLSNNTYDCIILTQTLPFIFDVQAAIANCFAILKSGGVLLATLPGISQISRYDMDRWGDYWRFTDASTQKLFENTFSPENVRIKTHGNVLVASALLYGLATSELKPEELDYTDKNYQVIITVRAKKQPSH